jgi:tetratricopeptide (TPR) repeat protein
MVIFEDLHWIDEQTQELLNLLADSLGTAKVLLLVNYRPEYSHQWNSKTYYTQLRLDPLGMESAEEMLTALVGDGIEVRPLKRLIIERTEGTPFFMEEIVQSLFEDGVLQRNGVVQLAKSMNTVKVPTTVQGVIAARIDRLPAEQKELLQTLAILGREFPLELVRRVMRKPDDNLNRMLSELQLAEFIYEQPASGDVEYTLKHALTQEVAYNSVLLERRQQLHERAGQALEAVFVVRLDDHLADLAHHYSRSSNVEKAIEYLRRTGEQMASRSAFRQAVTQLNRALEFVAMLAPGPERDSQEISVRLLLMTPLLAIGFMGDEAIRANFERTSRLCEMNSDSAGSVVSLTFLAVAYFRMGDLHSAKRLVHELLTLVERAPNEALRFVAHDLAGSVEAWMGHLRSAVGHFEKISDVDEDLLISTGYSQHLEFYIAQFGYLLWMLGYPDQMIDQQSRLLELSKKPINTASRAMLLQDILAYKCHFRREYRETREEAEALIILARENGLPLWLSSGLVRLGRIAVEEGAFETGIASILEGMRNLKSVGEELSYDYDCCVLAEAYLRAGRAKEGIAVLDETIPRAACREQHYCEPELYRLKGELLLLSGSADSAEESMRQAIAIAQAQDAKSWELRATMSLARLLDTQGRRDEARSMLADIYNWFTEGFDTADLKDAKTLLDDLSA